MKPVAFVNGRVVTEDGIDRSLRFARRILSIGRDPRRGDAVVDLDGAFVLPGLINAHDHLELNHYGRLKVKRRYGNASAWIADVEPLLRQDPHFRRQRRYPLADRLFVGALKNLLAGVTTVAHHNPIYPEIDAGFPIKVVSRFGWAHSFALEGGKAGARGEPAGNVAERATSTPARLPFVVHLAEGTDTVAASELPRFEALGLLRANSVLIHGVALTARDWRRMLAAGASVVWCPASNGWLFGRTLPAKAFIDASATAWQHLALGTDSRLTGTRDLLDELRVAAASSPLTPHALFRMVTTAPAHVLRLKHGGRIVTGAPADLVVLPPRAADPFSALLGAARRDIELVTIDGQPRLAAPRLATLFADRGASAGRVIVDGVEHLIERRLDRRLDRCSIVEPGVEYARRR